VAHVYNPSTQELRYEDCKFEANQVLEKQRKEKIKRDWRYIF
jgi:hypothetical protein